MGYEGFDHLGHYKVAYPQTNIAVLTRLKTASPQRFSNTRGEFSAIGKKESEVRKMSLIESLKFPCPRKLL